MPFLRRMLHSTNRNDQMTALGCLERAEHVALPPISEVIELIAADTTDPRTAYLACPVLTKYGSRAVAAIPALQARSAKESLPFLRLKFAWTLCKIDAGQTNALELIVEHAKTPNDPLRWQAFNALRDIGPNAQPAASVLAEAAGEDGLQVWPNAAEALVSIGETNRAVAIISERLKSKDQWARLVAAKSIVNYEPTNASAISNLVEFARHQYSGEEIEALAKLRPVPEAAVPILRRVAAIQDHPLRLQAQQALQTIDAIPPRNQGR